MVEFTKGFDERRAIDGPKSRPLGKQVVAAIVEIDDMRKLSKDGLIMLGQLQAVAQYRQLFLSWADASAGDNQARANAGLPLDPYRTGYYEGLYKAVLAIEAHHDQLQKELTAVVVRDGAGTVNHLKYDGTA